MAITSLRQNLAGSLRRPAFSGYYQDKTTSSTFVRGSMLLFHGAHRFPRAIALTFLFSSCIRWALIEHQELDRFEFGARIALARTS
jgi:hypothetical protein